MNQVNWIERLFSCAARPKARRDLSTIRCIDEWQGHLHRRFASVHIAGTNGKGSVALKIATALRAAGYNTGLYTSPHISTYRERIQLNGSLIEEQFAVQFLPRLFSFVDEKKLTPSFFDLLTALAFEYFAMKNIDIGVFETGLGGQFDATNIIEPRLSVITSINYDHCDILGPTLDQIAQAKAGIIKEGIPVVIGPKARFAPILNAAKKQAIQVIGNADFYDDENNAIARTALETMGVSQTAIEIGLQRRPPCRFEIADPRPIIMDAAHNPDGFDHLKRAWERYYLGKRFHLILAMGKERDPVTCIERLGDLPLHISCVSNGHPRLASASDLLQRLESNGIAAEVSSLEAALRLSENAVICGSFFIMSDVRRLLGMQEPRDAFSAIPMRANESIIETAQLSG